MAHQKWPEDSKPGDRRWKKAWYEPFDDIERKLAEEIASKSEPIFSKHA